MTGEYNWKASRDILRLSIYAESEMKNLLPAENITSLLIHGHLFL